MIRLYRWWKKEIQWDLDNDYKWHAILWYLGGFVFVAIVVPLFALLLLTAPIFTFWLVLILLIVFGPFYLFFWRKARK